MMRSGAMPCSGHSFSQRVDDLDIQLDADGDRQLSVNEVNVAVGDATLNGSEASAVAALKRSFRSKSYGLPPLTLDALRVLATNIGLDIAAPEVLRLEDWLTGAPWVK